MATESSGSKEPAPIRVLLVDDHEIVRDGVKAALESGDSGIKVVAQAANGREAVERFNPDLMDVVIIDYRMPRMSGPEAVKILKQKFPDVLVLVMSAFGDEGEEAIIANVIKCGAIGFLNKGCDKNEYSKAVRTVHAGKLYLAPDVHERYTFYTTDRLPDSEVGRNHASPAGTVGPVAETMPLLSERDLKIIRLLVKGLTHEQIARELGLRLRSVKTYLSNIRRLTNTKRDYNLLLFAIQNNLVDAPQGRTDI